MAFVPNFANPIGRNSASGNITWVYNSTTDTLATIKAASYFSTTNKDFAVNDIIFAAGTDGCTMLCISAIDGGGNVTTEPVDIQADEVGTATLPDIGEGTQNTVQEALEDVYNAVNDKIELNVNVGTGASIIGDVDVTDPTTKTQEIRRINGGDGIGAGTGGGDTLTIDVDSTVLRTVTSFGSGQSLVRSSNNAGDAELRSLVSSDGTLIYGTSGGGTEVNIRIPSAAIAAGQGIDVNFTGGVFTITNNFEVGGGANIFSGAGTPEGNQSASPGSLYLRTDPVSAQTIGFLKETGTGNTGWAAINT